MRACCIAAVAATVLSTTALAGAERPREIVDRVEWTLKPDVITVRLKDPRLEIGSFLTATEDPALAATQVIRSNRLRIHDLRIPAGSDPLALVARLRAHPAVDFAEPTYIGRYNGAPNDPQYADQYALENTGQTGGSVDADIDAETAWSIEAGSANVIVAVLDSGCDMDHEDLAGVYWRNVADPPNGIDDDLNGYVDDTFGWDFANDNNDPDAVISHGTHVAGIVGARRDNGKGIAGIAGGNNGGCTIMALGVGDFGPDGSILDDAILYAVDNGATVITMSLSVGQSAAIDAALQFAYEQHDVFIDCAAGNNDPDVSYPALNPFVMAVASTDDNDNVSSFSNPGPEVEIAAPGSSILSTRLNNDYGTSSGTSFAAPYVAGLAGLIRSHAPCLTNDEVRQLIIDTADDVEAPGYDVDTGWGRINAGSALIAISGVNDPCATGPLCPADLDDSGAVGFDDLVILLAAWGPCSGCPADLDLSGAVDFDDLVDLLASWGDC